MKPRLHAIGDCAKPIERYLRSARKCAMSDGGYGTVHVDTTRVLAGLSSYLPKISGHVRYLLASLSLKLDYKHGPAIRFRDVSTAEVIY